MIGLGTIINVAGILAGGILGLLFGKSLKESLRSTLQLILGLSTIFIGAGGVFAQMLTVGENGLSTHGEMMMIFSLVLGGIVGELINIEGLCERFGDFLKSKTGNGNDNRFVSAFVTCSMTVCIGAMAVIGSIQDGLNGNISILLTKTLLDTIMVMIMTAGLGIGSIFSAIPVLIWQGGITLSAGLIEPLMTTKATSNLSLVGSVLIFCVGLNLAFDKKIRVGNLLPAILFAVAFAFVPWSILA